MSFFLFFIQTVIGRKINKNRSYSLSFSETGPFFFLSTFQGSVKTVFKKNSSCGERSAKFPPNQDDLQKTFKESKLFQWIGERAAKNWPYLIKAVLELVTLGTTRGQLYQRPELHVSSLPMVL